MATQLGIYNRALTAMGGRRLATINEAREPKRVFDDLWSDCVAFCLEQGMWNFAMRTATVASAGAGAMGYTYVFTKPTDLVHLFAVADNAAFEPPLARDFIDQGASFYANVTPLYARYNSNDATSYGGNLVLWSQSFSTYVAHVLASWSALRLTGDLPLAMTMTRLARRYLAGALAIDSVPMLPGMLPFNADARALTVETRQAQPVEPRPFSPGMAADAAEPKPHGEEEA